MGAWKKLYVLESGTIENDIVERSRFRHPTLDYESKYETLPSHTGYDYTVIIIRSNPIG